MKFPITHKSKVTIMRVLHSKEQVCLESLSEVVKRKRRSSERRKREFHNHRFGPAADKLRSALTLSVCPRVNFDVAGAHLTFI